MMNCQDMPETDRLITSRRSIRKYRPEIPAEEHIREMVRCAAWAPSPSNSQPVRFFRINSPDLRHRLHQVMSESRDRYLEAVEKGRVSRRMKNWISVYWRYSVFMFDAPVLMAVGTLTSAKSFSSRLFKAGITEQDHRAGTDLAICTGFALENFFIKATDLGLGTCVLTAPLAFIPDPEKTLGLEHVRIMAFVTAGFPDESPGPAPRKPPEEIYIQL